MSSVAMLSTDVSNVCSKHGTDIKAVQAAESVPSKSVAAAATASKSPSEGGSVMQVCLRVRPMLKKELEKDSECLEVQS